MADIDGTRSRAIGPITILKGNFGTGLGTTDSGYTILAVDAYGKSLSRQFTRACQWTSPKLDFFVPIRRTARLTACHVIASNALDRVSRLGIDVAHADAGAVPLIDIIDKKVGEASVSVDDLGSCYCQQYALDIGKMHDLVRVLLTRQERERRIVRWKT